MLDINSIGADSRLDEVLRINSYLNLLLNSTGSIFLLLDQNGNILYCNDRISKLMGVKNINEIIGKPLRDMKGIYEDKAFYERCVERYMRLLAGEDDFTEDDVIDWPGIGRRIFQISNKRLNDEKGDFLGIALILHDVTEMRIQEENRRILERVQNTQMPCMIWDEKGDVIEYNQEARNFFGFSDDSPYDAPRIITAIQPERQQDGEKTENIRQVFINDTLEKGYSRLEVLLQKTDGTPLPLEAIGVSVSWQYGHSMLVYFRDLTDIKAKEAEAKEAEARLKTMLDTTPLICILRDEKNNIIDCNQETLNILGVSHKDYYLKNAKKFYPEFQPDGQKTYKKFENLIKDLFKSGKIKFEWMFMTIDKEPLPVETTLVPISWKGAKYSLSYSRDLREEKANEQRMQESIKQARDLEIQNERAQAASEAKSQFFASMSHEIRTPMNTIIGLLELIRTDNLDSEQKRYLREMKNMSATLLHIINDILAIYKIEAGKQEIFPVHFNLTLFYNQLISRHKLLAEAKKLIFTSTLAPDLPRVVFGDDLRIGQIITNLLSNAIKYTRKGFINFNVDSAWENGEEYIVFTVEDSGIGIEKKNFATLFDEFEQFDANKNRGITGAGLGLAIVKKLSELMGGRVRF